MDTQVKSPITRVYNGVQSTTPVICPHCKKETRIIGVDFMVTPNHVAIGVQITVQCDIDGIQKVQITVGAIVYGSEKPYNDIELGSKHN